MKIGRVTISVPASTSNLGSGFDTLGLALKLYNKVSIRRLPLSSDKISSNNFRRPRSSRYESALITLRIHELSERVSAAAPASARAIFAGAAEAFFRRTRVRGFALEIDASNQVPVGRGLGASVTARLAVIAALNELAGTGLTRQELLELVVELEGHPDNAAPAIFGGFTVSGSAGGAICCARFDVAARAKFVTLVPRFQISTGSARKLLPRRYSKEDTAHALNRAALITAAFAKGDFGLLRGFFDDRMHQPFREKLIPQLSRVIRAGESAGAIGGWLSGSGSSIICLTLDNANAVGAAMQRALPDSEIKVLTADNRGFTVRHD